MHNMMVVKFDSEEAAYQGRSLLWRLHDDSLITTYATSIMARADDGTVDTLKQDDHGIAGTATGMMVGSLIGILGGPAGVAAGVAVGATGGAMADRWDSELRREIVNEVAETIMPGEFLLLADVSESSEVAADSQLADLGGIVVRRPRSEVIKAHVAHGLASEKARLDDLQKRAAAAAGEAKESLREKISAAQEKLGAAWKKASENLKASASEQQKTLEKQIANAPAELRENLESVKQSAQAEAERRIEALKSEFGDRSD